jgi:hypothetical protein
MDDEKPIVRKAKPQSWDSSYRNAAYYRNIYKQMDMEQAYNLTVANLKNPTFSMEAECAIPIYEEVYQVPYQSKMEREKGAVELENELLKKRLAELEAAKPPVMDEKGVTIDPEDFPKGMDREAFKQFFFGWYKTSQGHEPDRKTWLSSWMKYDKNAVEV